MYKEAENSKEIQFVLHSGRVITQYSEGAIPTLCNFIYVLMNSKINRLTIRILFRSNYVSLPETLFDF